MIGSAIALNMQARGFSTILLDPVAVRRAASWGNAGHIAVEQAEPLASIASLRAAPRRLFIRGGALAFPIQEIGSWAPFALKLLACSRPSRFAVGKKGLRSILSQAMPAWRELLRLANASYLLREDGHFIVWETRASAAAGRRAWASADTGEATFRDATPTERLRIRQAIGNSPAGVIRFEGSGQISDLGQLAMCLNVEFEKRGGRQVCTAGTKLELRSGMSQIHLSDGRILSADAIVIAAGLGSAELLRPLGHCVPIIAERGYHIQFRESAWPDGLPPVVFEDRAVIVTKFLSGVRASSFVEFGRAETRPDPRKWQRLEKHASEIGIDVTGLISRWVGARPTFPDYLPAIGRSPAASNLFYAFGHQHLGLTLAAVTGEAMASLVADSAPKIDLAPFSLQRFGRI